MVLIRFWAVLILLLAVSTSNITHAQDETTWLYGWDQSTWEISAISSEGESQVILSDISASEYTQRISSETIFAGLLHEGVSQAYYLTPNAAYHLRPDRLPEGYSVDELIFIPRATTEQYGVISIGPEAQGAPAYLADFEDHSLTLLSDGLVYPHQIYFSQDGTKLRFIATDEMNSTLWSLWEWDLTTGEKEVIIQDDNFVPSLGGDRQFGERWVYISRETQEIRLLDLTTGEQNTLLTQDPTNPQGAAVLGETLIQWSWACEEDCSVTVTHLTSGTEQVFPIPITAPTNPIYLHWINEDALLLQMGDDLLRLNAGEDGQLVGTTDPRSIAPPIHPEIGQKFVLVQEPSEESFGVWSVTADAFIYNIAKERSILALIQNEHGFIFTPNFLSFVAYHAATETLTDLPESLNTCFILLADGNLICNIPPNQAEIASGIYRYDPTTQTRTLLREGAFLISR